MIWGVLGIKVEGLCSIGSKKVVQRTSLLSSKTLHSVAVDEKIQRERIASFDYVDLDYERRRVHSYRVIATDAGQPRRSGTSDLDVEILDIDDELPHFDVSEYRFRISENLPIGSVVGRVEATDGDSDPNFRRVIYFTDNSHDGQHSLSVDPLTGEIRTSAVLDRELTSSLTLRVFASPAADRPEVTSSSHCDVIVDVADVNDNAPQFLFPNDVNYTLFINADVIVAGKRLAKLDAADRDVGINANLSFFVDADDRHHGLDVESTSGLSSARSVMNLI